MLQRLEWFFKNPHAGPLSQEARGRIGLAKYMDAMRAKHGGEGVTVADYEVLRGFVYMMDVKDQQEASQINDRAPS